MGNTFSHMAAKRFFRFFALQGPLGRTLPSKCTSVFAVKLQSNAVFRFLRFRVFACFISSVCIFPVFAFLRFADFVVAV